MTRGLLYDTPDWTAFDVDELPDDPPPLQPPVADPQDIVLSLCRRRANIVAEAQALEARISELQERLARRRRAADWLRREMLSLMRTYALRSVRDAEYTISVTTRPPTIDVEDMLALPDEFVRVKREPDKIALNRHFKETGELPAGCRLVEGVETITIRSK